MNDRVESLSALVAQLKEDAVHEAVRRRIDEGEDPLGIMDECQAGIMEVGRLYEVGTYYISGLIMGGEIMQQVSELILPVLQNRIVGSDVGRILVGTVQGDIHYIGKNIFKTLLRCFGFTVRDAGEDVAPAEFVKQAKEFRPHVIGLSCLLNTSYDSMRDTISLLKEELKATDPLPRILIGGAVDAKVSRYVAADYWAKDAMSGVRTCQGLTTKTV